MPKEVLYSCERLLLSGEYGLYELAVKHNTTSDVIKNALYRLRKRYGERVMRTKKDKRTAYQIVPEAEVAKPKKPRTALSILPLDLWRGWVNPATGIIPAKLGL